MAHEKKHVSIRNLVVVTVVCVVVAVVAAVWVRSYFTRMAEEPVSEMAPKPGSLTLQELRAHEDEALTGYRTIDATHGIYQIPIDSAMALLAREAAGRI